MDLTQASKDATPGPWIYRHDPNGKPHFWVKTPGGFSIARVSGKGEPDAYLISLAPALPALVEALKAFMRAPSIGSNGPGSVSIEVTTFNLEAARAALALVEPK